MRGVYVDRTGEEGYNKFGSKIIIRRYINSNNVDVFFPEYNWTYEHAKYDNFKKGNLLCPYEKRFYGVGYLGEGKYKTTENGKSTKCYNSWMNMLSRGYSDNIKNKHPTYKESRVFEPWLNFQNYAKWYYENYYEVNNEQMHLDKDILVKGNKIYSPETCIFVPTRINQLFKKNDASRGEYPLGINYHKRDKVLEVWCRTFENKERKNVYLGRFELDQVEEAFTAYKTFKENYIKQVADDYYSKGLIPEKLYKAMYAYQVEITD